MNRVVASRPYSYHREGNWSWRWRVVELHVFVNGPWFYMEDLQYMLRGAKELLAGLKVS